MFQEGYAISPKRVQAEEEPEEGPENEAIGRGTGNGEKQVA